jgi:transposase
LWPHADFVDAMIEERKDITLDEMVVRLAAERELKIGRSALSSWLRSRGYTNKKRPRTHWSRNARVS